MNAQRRSVNLVPGMSAPAVLHASEGDVGRVLEIVIIDGQLVYNIPSTATVTITATKPSGMGFTQTCTVTENGTATFETTASMTDESGKMQAEVRIVDGGKNIGTANLLWIVERNPHPSNVIDGDVERAKTILERAEEAMAKAEQMIEEVELYNSIVEEVEDARNGFDGVEYGTLGDAVRGQVDTLQGEIDKLNDGGLIIKDDVIEADVNEWLDKHPEATTTVQDKSLGKEKLTDESIAFLKETAKVIFMPVAYYENTSASGECTVFMTNINKKVVMIDSGATHSYSFIKNELDANDIDHIDVFILTHYHDDHYGNINSLISDGYIDSKTISYLPRSTSVDHSVAGWGDEAGVRDALSITEVNTPSSETPLIIDGMRFDFFNCDEADVAYYDSQPNPDCNNYSVCCYVSLGSTTILMTGDIQPMAEQRLYNNGLIRKCDVLKIPHHASYDGSGPDFYMSANPTYAVASVNLWSNQVSITLDSYRLAYLTALGTRNYILGGGAVYMGFNNNVYTFYPNKCMALDSRIDNLTLNIYVDKNYVGEYSDGTSKRPFKDVRSAVAWAGQLKPVKQIDINIVGDYIDTTNILYIANAQSYIRIIGETLDNANRAIIYALKVRNSVVDMTNITVGGAINSALEYVFSKGTLTNVVVDGDVSDGDINSGRGINVNSSDVLLSNCTLSNKNVAIMCSVQGVCTCRGLKGQNNNYLTSGYSGESVIVTSGDITFTQLIYSNHDNINVNFVKYLNQESRSSMMDLLEEHGCPWNSINAKVTIDMARSIFIAIDRIRYIYVQAKADENIGAWEILLSNIASEYIPFQTNGAYTINIGDTPYALNFNDKGVVNTPKSINQGQNIRINLIYLARDH